MDGIETADQNTGHLYLFLWKKPSYVADVPTIAARFAHVCLPPSALRRAIDESEKTCGAWRSERTSPSPPSLDS
jgi:hypothetical protein